MSAALEAVTKNRAFKLTVAAAAVTWNYVTERLWPIYSSGMVFGTIMLIASMHEKQTIADHFFGHKSEVTAEEVENASQLMEDELHRAVKADVYRMPAAEFQAEYALRQA
jgi:hypothetical protein